MTKNHSASNKTLVIFLGLGLTSIYGFPNMKNIFYSMLKNVLTLSDTEVSTIFALFGTVALCSYVIGGIVVDKLPIKVTVCGSLLFSSLLHVILSFRPSYEVILFCVALMSFSAIFLFFPASSKLITAIGNNEEEGSSGKLFGIYYALEAVFSLTVNCIGEGVLLGSGSELLTFETMTRCFSALCLFTSCILFFKIDSNVKIEQTEPFSLKKLKIGLSSKCVWLLALMTCGAYVSYTALSYIPEYLKVYHNIDGSIAIMLSIVRVSVMTILASLLVGKYSELKGSSIHAIKNLAPILGGIAAISWVLMFVQHSVVVCVALTMVFAFIVLGIKAISISGVSEMKIPIEISASIIGIVSFIGYSPDAFYFAFMGRAIDAFGQSAFTLVWVISVIGAIICFLCAKMLLKEKEA